MLVSVGKFLGSAAAIAVNTAIAVRDDTAAAVVSASEAYRVKRGAAKAQEGPQKALETQNEVRVIPDQLEPAKTARRGRATA